MNSQKNQILSNDRYQLILKLIYFLATVLFIYKSRLFLLEPRIWAEEGSVYLKDAILNGSKSLLNFHQGYYSIIPTFTFYVSTFFNYKYIPYFALFASLSVWVLLFFIVAKLINPLFKIFLFISLFVLLNQYQQLFLNTINLQFITPLLLLIFLQNDLENISKKKHIFLLVLIFLNIFNGVLGILLLPYLVYRLILVKKFKTLFFSLACVALYALLYICFKEQSDNLSLSERFVCNFNIKYQYWQKNQISLLKMHYYIILLVLSILFLLLKKWEISLISLICFTNFCFIDMTKLCTLQITERYRVYLYALTLIFFYGLIHKQLSTKLLLLPTLVISFFFSKSFFDTDHSYCIECPDWSSEYKNLEEKKKAKIHPAGWEIDITK
ncbi:hypothetical protein ASG31_14755 [Chryseobacterium sp. Leaf404]|uniref:hypothetical protein n=1 Tax=unclassified Chryseobacterium TaxID=2593645 RepID=UPI0006FB64A6|nr:MULTISPECIES: hypothetical protein [unclassified Chryseobacterium]KQT15518.1 hypothetical protein ASG31_14755 [Chryseobacterium sp. Leaf404]